MLFNIVELRASVATGNEKLFRYTLANKHPAVCHRPRSLKASRTQASKIGRAPLSSEILVCEIEYDQLFVQPGSRVLRRTRCCPRLGKVNRAGEGSAGSRLGGGTAGSPGP